MCTRSCCDSNPMLGAHELRLEKKRARLTVVTAGAHDLPGVVDARGDLQHPAVVAHPGVQVDGLAPAPEHRARGRQIGVSRTADHVAVDVHGERLARHIAWPWLEAPPLPQIPPEAARHPGRGRDSGNLTFGVDGASLAAREPGRYAELLPHAVAQQDRLPVGRAGDLPQVVDAPRTAVEPDPARPA